MIVFDLECRAGGHRFEGWFGSTEDFMAQQQRGLVACPECNSADVIKAPMAPKLARKGNQLPSAPGAPATAPQPMAKGAMPPEAARMLQALAVMQREALKDSRWVGDKFAEESRAMHYGEREAETIHGQASLEDAKALHEEGIEVAPLPFPVAPPGEAN
ncbi:MAG: DUF1178 family protein [Novosphingobium sp.]